MTGNSGPSLIDLMSMQEPDINRIIPVFVSRFNSAYGDPDAERWDISKDDWNRYEFLGDRVLNLIIAQALFVQRDDVLDEGRMTQILSGVVSNKSLDAIIRHCDTFSLLIPLSIGGQDCFKEKVTGGAFEAFIGALYCELGLDEVAYFVNALFAPALLGFNPRQNAKGILQEYFQKRGEQLPVYTETGRAGPAHRLQFKVRVTLADGRYFEGTGLSLLEAEKAAALRALEQTGQS